MSKLRVVTFAILLLLVVAVGCSSSDQAAIDKAVSATLTAAQPATAAPTATSTPEPLPTDTPVPEPTAAPVPAPTLEPLPTDTPVPEPTAAPTATSTTSQRLTDISSSSRSEQLSLLPTPFQNQTDYWALQPFVVQANQLEMQFHNGFDYFTDRNKVAVHAVSTGRVMFVEIFERARDGAFQINLVNRPGKVGDSNP